MKTILQKEVKNTYVELNRVRGGQQPSQSLNVTYQKDFATKEMGKYQIKDKDEG